MVWLLMMEEVCDVVLGCVVEYLCEWVCDAVLI